MTYARVCAFVFTCVCVRVRVCARLCGALVLVGAHERSAPLLRL